jgi:hypothetical protein
MDQVSVSTLRSVVDTRLFAAIGAVASIASIRNHGSLRTRGANTKAEFWPNPRRPRQTAVVTETYHAICVVKWAAETNGEANPQTLIIWLAQNPLQ